VLRWAALTPNVAAIPFITTGVSFAFPFSLVEGVCLETISQWLNITEADVIINHDASIPRYLGARP